MSYTSVGVRDEKTIPAFEEFEKVWISKDKRWKVVARITPIDSAPKLKFKKIEIYQMAHGKYRIKPNRNGLPPRVVNVYREFYKLLFLEG